MALGDKANSKNTGNNTADRVQQGNNDTREKAVAYINWDLPTKDGDKKRMSSLALVSSDPFHAQLIDYLSDPATRDERVKLVTAKLIASVNFIKTGDAALLDL
jgi:hypothetical protein